MIETILAVVGIFLTICFGIYSIWTYRKSKKTVSLLFTNVECYSLFKEDVKRLNLDLSYNNRPISNSLILLKANLINNGKTDIDKSRIYQNLKIITGKDFKWLEVNIISNPVGANIDCNIIAPNATEIKWDLLKSNEVIEIEALAETLNNNLIEKADEFYKQITFDFRITDLNKIQREEKLNKWVKLNRLANKVGYSMMVISFALGLFCLALSNFNDRLNIVPEKSDVFFNIQHDSIEFTAKINSVVDQKVTLQEKNTNKIIDVEFVDFKENYQIKNFEGLSRNTRDSDFFNLIGIIYLCLGLVSLLLVLSLRRKSTASNNE